MSDILAKLQAAHAGRKMTRVEVPEYGLDLYFPPFTVADHAAIQRGVNRKDQHALLVSALVHQARDKDGNRIFDVPLPEKPALMKELNAMEFQVLERIIAQSGGGLDATVAAEIVAAECDLVRTALAGVLEEQPELSKAVAEVPDEVLQKALTVIAEAQAANQSSKNG